VQENASFQLSRCSKCCPLARTPALSIRSTDQRHCFRCSSI